MRPRPEPWNHNIHYHDLVLAAVPSGCRRALDVGCGRGQLARRLSEHCGDVVAIDRDCAALAQARAAGSEPRITFVEGDVMSEVFEPGSFDFVAAIAVLHHLPLRPALVRLRDLLAPGGALAIIGLHRARSIADYTVSAAAFPASWTMRFLRGGEEVGAPVQDPAETLAEIRAACDELLAGAVLRRRLFFRYSLIWRNL